jgi:hypothetical protein
LHITGGWTFLARRTLRIAGETAGLLRAVDILGSGGDRNVVPELPKYHGVRVTKNAQSQLRKIGSVGKVPAPLLCGSGEKCRLTQRANRSLR